jgi:hypothetical protein
VNGVKDVAKADPGFNFSSYPNPFTTGTTLHFELKEACRVTLNVMDELGRPVRTIVDEAMDAGEKRYQFDGSGLPAGIYYCTLRAGRFSETRKLLKQ